MKLLKFAAVDIGSNAMRLLLSSAFKAENGQIITNKDSLIRYPLRLGNDVFVHGKFSAKTIEEFTQVIHSFAWMIKAYKPLDVMACSTSASREAENGPQVMESIRKITGVPLHIISGQEEADIIFHNHLTKTSEIKNSYLYIDVGGGSTELTWFQNGEKLVARSFPIGAVRLLNGKVAEKEWKALKEWVKEHAQTHKKPIAIGSGGNINKVVKLLGHKAGDSISVKKIWELIGNLESYTYEERIEILKLRPDRADVLVPALQVYGQVMKSASIDKIKVPMVGLVDGLVQIMAEKHRDKF